MAQTLHNQSHPVAATEADAQAARKLVELIERGLDRDGSLTLHVGPANESEKIALPPVVAKLVLDLLGGLAQGNAVAVSAMPPELSLDQASDILNLPRHSLVELIDEGRLAAFRTESEIRVRLEDTLAFKADLVANRKAALDELVAHDQALGLQ